MVDIIIDPYGIISTLVVIVRYSRNTITTRETRMSRLEPFFFPGDLLACLAGSSDLPRTVRVGNLVLE